VPTARHKRANGSTYIRGFVPLALAAGILIAVPVGVVAWPEPTDDLPAVQPISVLAESRRIVTISRALDERPPLRSPATSAEAASATPTSTPTAKREPTRTPTPTPEPTVTGHLYVTTALNMRAGPTENAEVVTVLAAGTEVAVTNISDGPWVQIVDDDEFAWVNGDYLSETRPAEEHSDGGGGGISFAECDSGSSVEIGLTPDAIRVHRAVCARFPEVTSYGGVRSGGGAHSTGHALDIMVSSSSLGDAVAAFVKDNYQALGVSEVIWSQQIWTVERASDGWRWMEDRGSVTANHYDHVHVTVYGYSGG
jgi:Bacterial SH3 domain